MPCWDDRDDHCQPEAQSLTQELNIPGTYAECESPIRAKQLDYVLFDVPNARANTIRNYFIRQIQELFAK